MENVKTLKANMDKELEKETARTYYGIFLLIIVYGGMLISFLYWFAENDKTLTK